MADRPLDLVAQPGGRQPGLLSFEFFPPRTDDAADRLWHTIDRLGALRPDFVSVTYGAGGSTRESSLATLRRIVHDTELRTVAHLTCVGASRDELAELIGRFLAAGIRNFLALRGDPPAEEAPWQPPARGLTYAQQLISLLWQVAAERDIERSELRIGVAAFPGGHAQSGSLAQDVAVLAEKERLGASFAITQLFFYPSEYAALVERARGAGVTIPIIPGLMPMLSATRLQRMGALSGQHPPLNLLAGLAERSGEARYDFGMAATEQLARALLSMGAPGLHIYTLNQAGPALDLTRRLSWTAEAGDSEAPPDAAAT